MSQPPNSFGQPNSDPPLNYQQPYGSANYQQPVYGKNPYGNGPGGDSDREHLQLLSIFQYVYAGIVALLSLVPCIHLTVGIVMLSGAMGNEGPPAEFGWIIIAFAGTIILFGLALAFAIFTAGSNLRKQTNRGYCIVIAAIQCLMVPLGTILGVFTLIVLMRPSVVAKFQNNGG